VIEFTRCNLSETDRVELIKRFEQVLGQHGLSFINEIGVAPVSYIGVPSPFVIVKKATDSPGRLVVFFRLALAILSFILLLLAYDQNLLLSISLITSSLTYLWLDSVLIWFEKEKGRVSIKWFVLSFLISMFIAITISPIIDTIMANLQVSEPLRFWVLELYGLSLIVPITFYGAFGSFKLYTAIAYFERTVFEDQFLAVRRCLRSIYKQSPFGESIDPVRDAISSETMFTILKYLAMLVVPFGLFYLWPFFFVLDIYPVPVFAMSVTALIVISFLLNRIVKEGKILFRKAMSIQVGTTALAAIPLSFLQSSFLWIGLYFVLGTVLLAVIWMSVQKVALENPQILGLPYFERQLAAYGHEKALHFVNQTLSQLETVHCKLHNL